jgi:pyrimidine deaminase RibD-like protein
MTDLELMMLAIREAKKCNWPEEKLDKIPKVGAVVSIDGIAIAQNPRDDQHHAEKIALDKLRGRELTRATVFTTLEPCTPGVRSIPGESCSERLIQAQVRKVVIGMLDPNEGVAGKGVLALQRSKISVELFPHRLAQRIWRLNDRFIRAQESLGIEITSLHEGEVWEMGNLMVRGTFRNHPRNVAHALVHVTKEDARDHDPGWWPQGAVTVVPGSDNQWEAHVQFGRSERVRVCIVRVNELGQEMINYYHKMKGVRADVISRVVQHYDPGQRERVRRRLAPVFWALPVTAVQKGIYVEASITIHIQGGDPNGWSKLVTGIT